MYSPQCQTQLIWCIFTKLIAFHFHPPARHCLPLFLSPSFLGEEGVHTEELDNELGRPLALGKPCSLHTYTICMLQSVSFTTAWARRQYLHQLSVFFFFPLVCLTKWLPLWVDCICMWLVMRHLNFIKYAPHCCHGHVMAVALSFWFVVVVVSVIFSAYFFRWPGKRWEHLLIMLCSPWWIFLYFKCIDKYKTKLTNVIGLHKKSRKGVYKTKQQFIATVIVFRNWSISSIMC